MGFFVGEVEGLFVGESVGLSLGAEDTDGG